MVHMDIPRYVSIPYMLHDDKIKLGAWRELKVLWLSERTDRQRHVHVGRQGLCIPTILVGTCLTRSGGGCEEIPP